MMVNTIIDFLHHLAIKFKKIFPCSLIPLSPLHCYMGTVLVVLIRVTSQRPMVMFKVVLYNNGGDGFGCHCRGFMAVTVQICINDGELAVVVFVGSGCTETGGSG